MGQDKFGGGMGRQTQKSGAKECLEPWVIKFVWLAKWRKGTYGTQPVVIWPPTAFADGFRTPMIGIQCIAHDSDGCFCCQSWFRQQA
jgi:hypothetical protein